MLIRYCPAPPLDAAIDCIWLSRRTEHCRDSEHMLPSGQAQLVITLHDSPIQWADPGSRVEWHSWGRGMIHGPQQEAELIAKIRRPLLIHPAVAYALRADRSGLWSRRVDEIQKHTGYSPRHFIELFHTAVGLTPKHYYRIRRFSSALTHIARADARLAAVALAVGYSDQAHFSREFRELAGVAPSTYCPRATGSEHHHVVDSSKKTSRLERHRV